MDPSKELESIVAQIEINGKYVDIEIKVTEGGSLTVDNLESPRFDISGSFMKNFNETFKKLRGETSDGIPIMLSNSFVSYDLNRSVEKILPLEVSIDETDNYVSQEGENVKIKFDIINQKFSSYEGKTLIKKPKWEASGYSLEDMDDRIKYIREHKTPVRTGEIIINQRDVTGNISHQFDKAQDRLEKLLELVRFAQGVGPSYIRAELESVNSIDECLKYTKYYSTNAKIGGIFKKELVNENNQQQYLEKAYDNFDNHIRNNLRLKMVLGYYLDAINITRSIEGRLLSVCSAIELLAKRYADYDGTSTKTRLKIEHLVDELNVETSDLAKYSITYKNRKGNKGNTQSSRRNNENSFLTKIKRKFSPITSKLFTKSDNKNYVSESYFYSYSRQYVVHGDNTPTFDELKRDYFAALALLQRIIRNQLLKSYQNIPRLRKIIPADLITTD